MRQSDFIDEQDRADALALAAERTRQSAAQDAAIRASAAAGLDDANRRALFREYQAVGIEPVYADKAKTIPVALSMLRSLGWTVEMFEGSPRLVAPPAPKPWTGRRDRDSLPESSGAKDAAT